MTAASTCLRVQAAFVILLFYLAATSMRPQRVLPVVGKATYRPEPTKWAYPSHFMIPLPV